MLLKLEYTENNKFLKRVTIVTHLMSPVYLLRAARNVYMYLSIPYQLLVYCSHELLVQNWPKLQPAIQIFIALIHQTNSMRARRTLFGANASDMFLWCICYIL